MVLLGLWVEVILEGGLCWIFESVAVVALIVGSDGKLPEVLSSDVEAGYSPRFEAVGVVASDEYVEKFFPRLVHLCPNQLRCLWRR